jgi:hypothetical protein
MQLDEQSQAALLVSLSVLFGPLLAQVLPRQLLMLVLLFIAPPSEALPPSPLNLLILSSAARFLLQI